MASTTHANLAEDAAAYLGRSSDPLLGIGSDPKEIERQSGRLIEWATKNNALLSDAYTSGLEGQEGTTAEHEVFLSFPGQSGRKMHTCRDIWDDVRQKGRPATRHAIILFP